MEFVYAPSLGQGFNVSGLRNPDQLASKGSCLHMVINPLLTLFGLNKDLNIEKSGLAVK